jgi:hypothetical protein
MLRRTDHIHISCSIFLYYLVEYNVVAVLYAVNLVVFIISVFFCSWFNSKCRPTYIYECDAAKFVQSADVFISHKFLLN